MQAFSTAELAAMQAAQQAGMQDTCIIQTYSETINTYGQPVPTWTDGTAQACGVYPKGLRESHNVSNTTVQYDATIRLPVGTVVDMRDRVKVTHRFGVAVTNVTYGIIGPVRRGASGVQIDVRLVTL
jgi:head-tail adaptor